jgi:precorrin-2/cobalt-factor-2 C20-methyltransferase
MVGAQAVTKTGTLYGVGVGPGDPELLTVKAWRLISMAEVIAYLAANGISSTARDIARPFIPERVEEIVIDMPMRREREPAQAAYDQGAAAIAARLAAGKDVIFLCEGDPFFYGSFMYLFGRLSPHFETVVVPGVTSLTAAAARLGRPLARRNDVVKVLPATLEPERLRAELSTADAAAIIKAGRHFAKVRDVLAELGLTHHATLIENATRESERICPVAEVSGDSVPYFSTVLVIAGKERR